MANKQRNLSSPARNRHEHRQNQTPKRSHRKRTASRRNSWFLVGGSTLLIAAVVIFFVFLSSQSSSKINGQIGIAADATTLRQVTTVDPTLLSETGQAEYPIFFKYHKALHRS